MTPLDPQVRELIAASREAITTLRDAARAGGLNHFKRDPCVVVLHRALDQLDALLTRPVPQPDGHDEGCEAIWNRDPEQQCRHKRISPLLVTRNINLAASRHDGEARQDVPERLRKYLQHLPICDSRSCASCSLDRFAHLREGLRRGIVGDHTLHAFKPKDCSCGFDAARPVDGEARPQEEALSVDQWGRPQAWMMSWSQYGGQASGCAFYTTRALAVLAAQFHALGFIDWSTWTAPQGDYPDETARDDESLAPTFIATWACDSGGSVQVEQITVASEFSAASERLAQLRAQLAVRDGSR